MTGQPVTGACVYSSSGACTTETADGVYTFGPFIAVTTLELWASHYPNHFPVTIGSAGVSFGQIQSLTVRMTPGAVVEVPLTAPSGVALPDQICVAAVRNGSLSRLAYESQCAKPVDGRLLAGPFNAGPAQFFLREPSFGYLGSQWATATGGSGDDREAPAYALSVGTVTTIPTQHLGQAGTIWGQVTGADGMTLKQFCAVASLLVTTCSEGAGSYILSGLGPYKWRVRVDSRGTRDVLGWSGGAENSRDATLVQVVGGRGVRADIDLPTLKTVVVSVAGAPQQTLQVDAFDATTGDWESGDGGGYALDTGLTLNGPVLIRVQSPVLAQPCWYDPRRFTTQPYYTGKAQLNWLTLTPGVNCTADRPPLISDRPALPRR
ncbi:hypothetical protein AB0M47_17265 [Hamadaea sp. NPDC051192]|uniref:hypothetical protein n=1 Tax=Hamadaea sp. NPDC051192 TaxID=3154940 RepID=UPI003423D53E